VSQLAHGREDERLQPVDVLLRREGDADPVELAELAVAPVRFAQSFKPRIQSGNPGGRSSSMMRVCSAGVMVSP